MTTHDHVWTGMRARIYAMLHRNPASNRSVVEWAELDPSMKVLDIGCGTGAAVRTAAPLLARGRARGVDPSPDFIRIARRRSRRFDNVSFDVATAEKLPFEDGTFDVVWSVHSAHHWHDASAGIAEACRVLRPGGRLLIVERNDSGRPWGISRERADTLADMLGNAGLEDIGVENRPVERSHEFLIRGRAGRA